MDFEESPGVKKDPELADLAARLGGLEKELRSTQQELAKSLNELQD